MSVVADGADFSGKVLTVNCTNCFPELKCSVKFDLNVVTEAEREPWM